MSSIESDRGQSKRGEEGGQPGEIGRRGRVARVTAHPRAAPRALHVRQAVAGVATAVRAALHAAAL